MSYALGLYRLQQVDTRIDQANNRLEAIRAVLENNSAMQAARAALEKAEKHLHEAEKLLRSQEAASESQRIKIEQTEASLYGGRVQNPKELQDLQNELASLKRHLAALEDSQLESMLEVESARSEHKAALGQLTQVEGQLISQNASLKSEQDALRNTLENLQAERSATHSTIQPLQLEKYEALRQKRRGLAVVTISDNACDACGAGLTPAQAQAVRISNQLVECPSCGRILFSN